MLKRSVALTVLFLATALLGQQTAKAPAPKTVYIRAGHLFDATSDNMRDNVVIQVVGDRIQSVAPAQSALIPRGATVIDLSHATVLPGLIDCHVHLDSRADRYDVL